MKMKHKESEYYKELKNTWKKDYWTWEKLHKLGRSSYRGYPADAGVRMECERLATKVTKGIPLIKNDIRFLERLERVRNEERK